jgi:hypothetical protein
VHDLPQAQAALEAAARADVAIVLRSAPGAAQYAGLGFLEAVFAEAHAAVREARSTVTLDCGDDGALAHQALRHGFRDLRFAGPRALCDRLAEIAAPLGAQVSAKKPPRHALDLLHSVDPLADCSAYLARFRR